MATRLKAELVFEGLAPGVPSTVPHGLNAAGTPLKPDFSVRPSDVSVVYTDTTVTVTNNGAAPLDFTLFVEAWHTLERELGALANLAEQPFEVVTGTAPVSSGGGFVPQAGPPLVSDAAIRSSVAIFVNPRSSTAADDGDPDTPKLTITGALACIPVPTSSAEQLTVYNIIVSGGYYDENIVIPPFGLKVNFIGLGLVTVGDGESGTEGASTTPRNVSWSPNPLDVFGSSSIAFVGAPLPQFTTFGTQENPFPPSWRVSGSLTMSGNIAGTQFLSITGALIDQGIDLGNFDSSLIVQLANTRVVSIVLLGAQTTLASCDGCNINLLEGSGTSNLGKMVNSTIDVVDLSQSTGAGGEWHDCDITGAWSQDLAGGAPYMDRYTARQLLLNSGFAPPLGPNPVEQVCLLGIFGAEDIGAGIGTTYLPVGGYAATSLATDDSSLLAAGYDHYLASLNIRIGKAGADGDNFALEVLLNGVVIASIPAVTSAGPSGQYVNLGTMVKITAGDAISVRIVKAVNITSGAINVVVTLYGY